MIRVWVETASTVMRAGLQALLEGSAAFDLVESPAQADVVLLDELPERPGIAPIVVLSDEPLTSRMFRLGVHAILPRESGAEQIVAALYAASAGLIAIPSEASSLIVPTVSEYLVENLTPRETETLEMLSEGLSNKQIAARLNISEHTAKFHVNSVLGKLNAATRTEAVIARASQRIVKSLNPSESEFALEAAGGALADEVGDFAQQTGDVHRLDKHRVLSPGKIWTGGFGCSEQGGRRLIVHHFRMRQDLQARLRRFHLQIAQDQLVLTLFQFPDGFGGAGSRINIIAAGFEDGFQRQAGRRIVVDEQYARQVVIEATGQVAHLVSGLVHN